MVRDSKSVLVVGFNTRPLAYSLNEAGYTVHAVDFFGDLDLLPSVKDCLIVTKELKSNYHLIKDKYGEFLSNFALDLLQKHPDTDYLLIGSGLDDAFKEREFISSEIEKKGYSIVDANNNIETIKKARDIKFIHGFLRSRGYQTPLTHSYDEVRSLNIDFQFPLILKKKTGSGGVNVYKINNKRELSFTIKRLSVDKFKPMEWLVQEFLEGIPVSCTVISNGEECEIISLNRQIIGEKFLNSPKDFMYCGNVVPSKLLKDDLKLISEISILLAKQLGLKGINGFDYVLKNHYPYLMEINPRIPGSIRASELVLNLNLLDLHIKSFDLKEWLEIKRLIKNTEPQGFATKLIMFAPCEVNINKIKKINKLPHIHDKSEPIKSIFKGEPLCTVLNKGKNHQDSYFGALKMIDKIKDIIESKEN